MDVTEINFETTFKRFPGLYLLLSPDLEVLSVTDNFLSVSGQNRNEIVGQHLVDLYPEKAQSLETQDPNSKMFSPILDQDGKTQFFILSFEREKISKNPFLSYHKATLDNLPQLIFIANPQMEVTYLNERWNGFSGHHHDDNLHRQVFDSLHCDDGFKVLDSWKRASLMARPFEVECRIFRASINEYLWHLLRCTPQLSAQGKVEYWVGVLTEIDRQRKAREYYEANGEKFRLITETIPQMVWRANSDGTMDYFNQNFLDYLGYPIDKVLRWGWLDLVHEEDRSRVVLNWNECRQNESSLDVEFRVRRSNGQYRWVQTQGNPFRDKSGHTRKYYGTWTDIEATKRAIEQAELAVQSKSAFLANMSHEIRTPLGVIRGFADILEESPSTSELNRAWISTIRRNAYHLSSLVDELLDLSKIESDQFEVEHIKFGLEDLLEDVTSLLKRKAQEKGLVFKVIPEGSLPKRIVTDPTRLKQILINLIGNAIKFTEVGKIEVKIKFKSTKQIPAMLEIQVKDTGIGMTLEHQKRLFKPFTQADNSTTRKFGGTGLGLYISKRLAMALEGNLYVASSAPGVGSAFTLTLNCGPLTAEDFHESVTDSNRNQNSHVENRLHGTHILLVEDSLDNQALISLFLTQEGARVTVAQNGLEGIDMALRLKDVDLILMDIQMPELDGFGATQSLRQKGYLKPIVALTAHALKQERDRCLRSGFDDHLSKPIHRESLIAVVSAYRHLTSGSLPPGSVTSSSPFLLRNSFAN